MPRSIVPWSRGAEPWLSGLRPSRIPRDSGKLDARRACGCLVSFRRQGAMIER